MNCAAKLRFLEGSVRIRHLHIIIALFIIGSMSSATAQTAFDDGVLDLHFNIIWNGTTWESSIVNEIGVPREGWFGYEIQRSDTAPPKLVAKHNYSNSEVGWEIVRRIHINVGLERLKECPSTPAKLSDFKMLDDCPITSLDWLVIDYSNYRGSFEADLENCNWFDSTQQQKTLSIFHLIGNHAPKFDLSAIYGQPLKTLKISKTLGEEVCQFSSLEQLEMPGIRNAFAHHAYSLPNLQIIRDVEGGYFNRFHYEHAERYFWLRSTSALHRPISSPPVFKNGVYSSPLNALIAQVKENLPNKWVKKGYVYVNEDELPARTHFKGKGDTLLHGFVKRGKPKGIWTLRVEEQYDYNDFEAFHLDMKAPAIELPDNGVWQLNYVGGNTAISGTFKNGRKVGEWQFYSEVGVLVCTRSFSNDTLKRTIVNFHMHGTPLQSRAYYFSENASIQSFQTGNKVKFMYIDRIPAEEDAMIISENSIAIQNEEGQYKVYYRNHPEFDTIFRSNVIDKVFPEFIGKEIPFEY